MIVRSPDNTQPDLETRSEVPQGDLSKTVCSVLALSFCYPLVLFSIVGIRPCLFCCVRDLLLPSILVRTFAFLFRKFSCRAYSADFFVFLQ